MSAKGHFVKEQPQRQEGKQERRVMIQAPRRER